MANDYCDMIDKYHIDIVQEGFFKKVGNSVLTFLKMIGSAIHTFIQWIRDTISKIRHKSSMEDKTDETIHTGINHSCNKFVHDLMGSIARDVDAFSYTVKLYIGGLLDSNDGPDPNYVDRLVALRIKVNQKIDEGKEKFNTLYKDKVKYNGYSGVIIFALQSFAKDFEELERRVNDTTRIYQSKYMMKNQTLNPTIQSNSVTVNGLLVQMIAFITDIITFFGKPSKADNV